MKAYYNENDLFAASWLRALMADGLIAQGVVDDRDIRDVRPADLAGFDQCHFFAGIGGWAYALQLANWPVGPVWTGSCPCQPFSDAGEGKGFRDPRHLWPTWFRLIQECRPPIVFGEQVASASGLAWFDHVATDLEALDYAIGAADLPAACVEAPHIRQRLFFVAHSIELRRQGAIGAAFHAREEISQQIGGPAPSAWPPRPGAIWSIPIELDGLPNRMGMRRGAGNAIVPQVAAEFIRACREAIA